MSNLINPKPRFGFNPSADTAYDYVAQRDVPLTDKYPAKDGVWNLLEVKRLILAGETVEAARRDYTAAETAAKAAPKTAASTTAKTLDAPGQHNAALSGAVPPAPGRGLDPAQLQALKLTAIQAAAMGITPTMMNATGVTGAQVQGWGLTSARADALKLNADQRAALLSGS